MDKLTPQQRHTCMSHNRGKDTSIELKLRKALWTAGYHYRKNVKVLPGTPDIVLSKYRIAIFCDSEFWHGKDWPLLRKHLEIGHNSDYWIKEINKNIEHDDEVNKQLFFLDWIVLRFWRNDILKHTDECIQTIKEKIEDIKYLTET